jgi:hypothetical protein
MSHPDPTRDYIDDKDLDQMWEEEKKYRSLTALEKILLLLERQHRTLEAMKQTCTAIEKTLKGE